MVRVLIGCCNSDWFVQPRTRIFAHLFVEGAHSDCGIELSYSRKEWALSSIRSDQPVGFVGIQDDPRYLDLLKRLGLD